ncbi:Aldo/keto reductase family protein [Kosakonia oryziphila]|uniref:Aldo/keto reductase family protein n=1 Tax=Kosakonia oryziphila TaxID=1005667 RepID=A0A1C4EY77_9ENTR|nr:Aldo/keto reductase family protein [Kosakonia oryziphila]
MPGFANPNRYKQMQYRYCGKSGLQLPALSLGLWHSFGHGQARDLQRALLRKAFDLGITHFDLANNYGPPAGSAEENFGRLLRDDFAAYRDEIIISTKAGYDMWPGPYGSGGSRKYLLASLDQSLKRMGVAYVDIFYSHRVDEKTPMEETALRSPRRCKAVKHYMSASLLTPLNVHNRWQRCCASGRSRCLSISLRTTC